MLNPVTAEFETRLRGLLPEAAFRPVSEAYLTEPRGRFRGHGLVVAPGATDEVATLLAACNDARVGVVPYGGGTGLVGGQLMPDGPAPVILSLERMNAIRAVYPSETCWWPRQGRSWQTSSGWQRTMTACSPCRSRPKGRRGSAAFSRPTQAE